MEGYIYRAYLPSGISYIGQTINFEQRKRQHTQSSHKSTTLFHTAIKIFGKESLSWEILETCAENKLNERECYWIEYYDSYDNGLNDDTGGKMTYNARHYKRTEEMKQNMSDAHLGQVAWNKDKELSETHIENLIKNHKGTSGLKMSEESNEKRRNKMKGKYKGRHRVDNGDGTFHYEF